MYRKTKKLFAVCLVVSMLLTMTVFSSVASAATSLKGTDRYQTALAVVKAGWTESENVVIARGDDLADALAAAPLAYAKGKAPILLTETSALPTGVMEELEALKVKNVYIVGGPGAVSAEVEAALAAKFTVKRLFGADRAATSLAVAKEAFTTAPAKAVLVNGYATADALSISSIAAYNGMPILLANSADEVSADVAAYLTGKTVYAVGGTGVLSAAVVGSATRLYGADRYATNVAVLKEFELDYSKVFVAIGEDANNVDALGGAAFAALGNNPMVLVEKALTPAAKALLEGKVTGNVDVYTLGGLVPAAVATAIEGMEPDELRVESVTALNLKQMEVKFNKAVDEDSAEDSSNYDLNAVTSNSTGDLSGASFALQSDDKTVVITFANGNEPSQQDKYDFTIDGVLDTEEKALKEVTFEDVEFLDTTLPTATKAEVIGIDTIKVTFSEPIETIAKSDFEINDGDLYVKSVTMSSNNKVAKVELYSDLEEGEITVALKSSIEDYAGFGLVPKTFELDVVEDKTAPKVVSYEDADPNEVTLVFDEDIKVTDGTLTNFYHTNSNNEIDSYSVSGKELTLHFDTNELPEGTAYVYIEDESISDYWENENASKIMVKVEITVDKEAPVLEDIDVDAENKITLTFSEDVADVDKSDFKVVDVDDDSVNIKRVTVSGDEVSIEFYDNLSGEYEITVENLEDKSDNEIAKVTMEFTVDDETAPLFSSFNATIYNPGADGQKIVIDFGEKMAVEGTYSVLDLAKYVVNGKDLSELDSNVTIKAVNNGESVEIRVPATTEDTDDGVNFAAGQSIVIARVADDAGNYTAALASTGLTLGSAGEIDFVKVQATATDTIKVTFADEFSDFDAEDLIVYVDTEDDGYQGDAGDTVLVPAGVDLDTNDDGQSVATITLEDGSKVNADGTVSGNPVRVATVASGDIDTNNEYGDTLVDGIVAKDAKYTVADKIVPAIAKNADGDKLVTAYDKVGNDDKIDTLVIEYNEAIDYTIVTRLTYSVDDITVNNVYVSDEANAAAAIADTTPADGKFVVIELNNADSDLEVDAAYEPSVVQEVNIVDAIGNVLKASTDAVDSMDNAPAQTYTVSLASDNKTLTITFSEPIANNTSSATALKAGVKFDAAGTTPVALATGDSVTISGDTLTVKFAAALAGTSNRVTIDASTLKDANGNILGAFNFTGIEAN